MFLYKARSTLLCKRCVRLRHINTFQTMTHSSEETKGMKRKTGGVDPEEYTILKEGSAEILMHGNDVFYNKAQIVNRDLSIAVLRAYVVKKHEENIANRSRNKRQNINTQINGESQCQSEQGTPDSSSKTPADNIENEVARDATESYSGNVTFRPLRILEALSASGLRALRYAREVEGVGSVVALDNDQAAFEACTRNIKLNGSVAISKVQSELADARVYMLTHEKQFDAVDIDPYGSPSVFLDSAVQSVADGGLLMCTATDMSVLCGNYGEVCYSKYDSYPVRGKYCHEMALRILLSSIESHANRYKRHIVPLLSVSVDFYVRVFVRIFTSPSGIKESPSKLSYIYQCVGCDSFYLQPVGQISQKNNNTRFLPGNGPVIPPDCKHCGKRFHMGGPIWSHPIHDPEWVSSILKGLATLRQQYPAYDKVHSILTTISEEILDVPLYLSLHSLGSTLKCVPPSASLFRYAVANAGYRISGTHACPLGLKTDAPMDVIWDIMRCWIKAHPVKAQPLETPGSVILSKESTLEANFSKVASALSRAQTKRICRFLPNPEEFWGPKPRAGRQISNKHASSVGLSATVNGSHAHQETLEGNSAEETKTNQQQ